MLVKSPITVLTVLFSAILLLERVILVAGVGIDVTLKEMPPVLSS